MRPRLDASHERMFGEKNSLFGVTAHLDKRRTESFFLQTFFHRSEEHTSELQSRSDLVCRLLLEKKKSVLPLPLASQRRHCVLPSETRREDQSRPATPPRPSSQEHPRPLPPAHNSYARPVSLPD